MNKKSRECWLHVLFMNRCYPAFQPMFENHNRERH